MVKKVILVLLLGIVLTTPRVQAESASEPGQSAASSGANEQIVEDEPDQILLEQSNQIDSGASSNQRSVSSAIETFTPTEEISADNAVPFPVDI